MPKRSASPHRSYAGNLRAIQLRRRNMPSAIQLSVAIGVTGSLVIFQGIQRPSDTLAGVVCANAI